MEKPVEFEPILYPFSAKVRPKTNIPIGLYIKYPTDEMEAVEHFLDFARVYLNITKRSRNSRAHPTVQFGELDIGLVFAVKNTRAIVDSALPVAFGFYYPKKAGFKIGHVDIFHAYKTHLDADKTPGLESVKNVYAGGEKHYFPLGKDVH